MAVKVQAVWVQGLLSDALCNSSDSESAVHRNNSSCDNVSLGAGWCSAPVF